jgi:hypothetical protein
LEETACSSAWRGAACRSLYTQQCIIIQTIRVVTQQGTLIVASFMQDQLEHDMKRNELVQQGKLSLHEAEEWEKVRTQTNERLPNIA